MLSPIGPVNHLDPSTPVGSNGRSILAFLLPTSSSPESSSSSTDTPSPSSSNPPRYQPPGNKVDSNTMLGFPFNDQQSRRRSSTWSETSGLNLDVPDLINKEATEISSLINLQPVVKPAQSTSSIFNRFSVGSRKAVRYNFFGEELENNQLESLDDNEVYCLQNEQKTFTDDQQPQTALPTVPSRSLFRFFSRNPNTNSNPNLRSGFEAQSPSTPPNSSSSWWDRLTFGSNRTLDTNEETPIEREMVTISSNNDNVNLEMKKEDKDDNFENYIVSSTHETLNNIAARFHTTPSELKSLNRLTHDFIFVGQVLKIPKCIEVRLIDY